MNKPFFVHTCRFELILRFFWTIWRSLEVFWGKTTWVPYKSHFELNGKKISSRSHSYKLLKMNKPFFVHSCRFELILRFFWTIWRSLEVFWGKTTWVPYKSHFELNGKKISSRSHSYKLLKMNKPFFVHSCRFELILRFFWTISRSLQVFWGKTTWVPYKSHFELNGKKISSRSHSYKLLKMNKSFFVHSCRFELILRFFWTISRSLQVFWGKTTWVPYKSHFELNGKKISSRSHSYKLLKMNKPFFVHSCRFELILRFFWTISRSLQVFWGKTTWVPYIIPFWTQWKKNLVEITFLQTSKNE